MFAAMAAGERERLRDRTENDVDLCDRTAADNGEPSIQARAQPGKQITQRLIGNDLVGLIVQVEQRTVQVQEQAGGLEFDRDGQVEAMSGQVRDGLPPEV